VPFCKNSLKLKLIILNYDYKIASIDIKLKVNSGIHYSKDYFDLGYFLDGWHTVAEKWRETFTDSF
jgi:hypothetical protein